MPPVQLVALGQSPFRRGEGLRRTPLSAPDGRLAEGVEHPYLHLAGVRGSLACGELAPRLVELAARDPERRERHQAWGLPVRAGDGALVELRRHSQDIVPLSEQQVVGEQVNEENA